MILGLCNSCVNYLITRDNDGRTVGAVNKNRVHT